MQPFERKFFEKHQKYFTFKQYFFFMEQKECFVAGGGGEGEGGEEDLFCCTSPNRNRQFSHFTNLSQDSSC